jgi:hypothetical protein
LIPELRTRFNREFSPDQYVLLLDLLKQRCGTKVGFRVAETPIFVPLPLLEAMAEAGADLAHALIADPDYLAAARQAIPFEYRVAGETAHPNFLTADFGLVKTGAGELVPRLVEIQAFPSVYGYQDELSSAYRDAFKLPHGLGCFLGRLDETGYWNLFARTVLGNHSPENVVLTELDPLNQKTRPDFEVTAQRLGIAVVDIRSLEGAGNKLHYRNAAGRLIPIHRIYNRTIADELIARQVRLPFDLTKPWDVEWAGHPNWYFLISKFSIPWLSSGGGLSNLPRSRSVVPLAVFLDDFLEGDGRMKLAEAGIPLVPQPGPDQIYSELLLKPLFSFAGKGIQFEPRHAQLEAIPPEQRAEFLLQQRVHFEPTIETPHGLTQRDVLVHCVGRVVRCSIGQTQYLAAATIDEYRFAEQ